MQKHLLEIHGTLFRRFFSRFIPVRTLAFWTDPRVFFLISWDPFVPASFAFEPFYGDLDFSHSYEVYYFKVYKFSVYYREIFIYLQSIYFVNNILNK